MAWVEFSSNVNPDGLDLYAMGTTHNMAVTRRNLLLSGLGGATLALLGCTDDVAIPAKDTTPVATMEWPAVAPHRGGLAIYPENTTQAFKAMVRDYPNYGLEMDVRQLKDGALVIFHDNTVDRITAGNETGRPEDMNTAQWKKLRVKDPSGGPPEPVIFLDEALAEFGGTDTVMLIELKAYPAVSKYIEAVWPYRGQVIACCFNPEVGGILVRSGLQTQQLFSNTSKPFVEGVQHVGVLNTKATKEFCARAHAAGARVWVWGDSMDMGRDKATLMASGVDGFMPDDPRP